MANYSNSTNFLSAKLPCYILLYMLCNIMHICYLKATQSFVCVSGPPFLEKLTMPLGFLFKFWESRNTECISCACGCLSVCLYATLGKKLTRQEAFFDVT